MDTEINISRTIQSKRAAMYDAVMRFHLEMGKYKAAKPRVMRWMVDNVREGRRPDQGRVLAEANEAIGQPEVREGPPKFNPQALRENTLLIVRFAYETGRPFWDVVNEGPYAVDTPPGGVIDRALREIDETARFIPKPPAAPESHRGVDMDVVFGLGARAERVGGDPRRQVAAALGDEGSAVRRRDVTPEQETSRQVSGQKRARMAELLPRESPQRKERRRAEEIGMVTAGMSVRGYPPSVEAMVEQVLTELLLR